MLKNIRRILAAVFFVLISLLFLDFTGTLHNFFSWLAEIQLIPAILAVNIVVIVLLVILTLVFGRIYCSVICPLGVFQDIVARIGRRGKKMPYSYSKAKSFLRYSILGVFVIVIFAGISAVVSILDPYAAFGRIANNLFQPLWKWGNNLLAYFAERADSYAFYSVDVWIKTTSVFVVAAVTLILIAILAWRGGRTYCNTVCPVGTLLGFVSRFSLFRITMDKEKCVQCNLCSANCKSSCIDVENFTVDNSRCVSCMNCIDKCNKDAIGYKNILKLKTSSSVGNAAKDNSRRGFMAALLALSATAVKSQVLPKQVEMKVDGGLAEILDKKTPEREMKIVPPGAHSIRNFENRCTACQLCVSACPNDVLKPSSSLDNFMQPEMSFNKGYCRPECVKCSEVCPSDAISPIDVAMKSATQIGHAVWVEDRCTIVKNGDKCNNCERHCPAMAITMVDRGFKHPVPMINTERCIGCGACENLCPSRPLSAIYVEGHSMHRTV